MSGENAKEPSWLARRLLPRLAEGSLPPLLARVAHRRALTDPEWRAYYDQLRATARAARGSPSLTDAQRRLLTELIIADAPVAETRSSALRLTLTGGLAVACMLVFLVLPRGEEVWHARGGGAVVGIRVRCVDAVTHVVSGEAEGGQGSARVMRTLLRCDAHHVLVVDATNLGPAPRELVLVLASREGIGAVASTITVPSGGVRVLVPEGIELLSLATGSSTGCSSSTLRLPPRCRSALM